MTEAAAAPPLSDNPKPEHPRPPMTFQQQAELLEYLHGRVAMEGPGGYLAITHLDRPQIDDLWLTAQRLRRMGPFEDDIRRLVTGR